MNPTPLKSPISYTKPKPTQSSYKILPPALSRGESLACPTDNNYVAGKTRPLLLRRFRAASEQRER